VYEHYEVIYYYLLFMKFLFDYSNLIINYFYLNSKYSLKTKDREGKPLIASNGPLMLSVIDIFFICT